MLWNTLARSAPLVLAALAAAAPSAPNVTGPDADGKYLIESDGIRAYFIRYGAAISNLFVKDVNGVERDVVLGFDNASYYEIDKMHPYLGGVVGRYANRIKNSTFTIDGVTSHIIPNENNNNDTLHGGPKGYDWRNWTVEAHTANSITFSLFDPDGEQGFPGDVISYVTYTVTPRTWHIKMIAEALTKKTPILMSSHVYWNLDGFANPNTPLILNHTLSMPYGGQRVSTDGILIPNGDLLANKEGSVNDFWSKPKQIGTDFYKPEAKGNCGTNCNGYDTCYTADREALGPYNWRTEGPVASLSSDWSGIKVDVFSDQQAYQIYTCSGQNGTLALKKTQGIFNDTAKHPRTVQQYGCIVMEVEDYIDGINHPEWHRQKRQIYGPDTGPFVLEARYDFSTYKK